MSNKAKIREQAKKLNPIDDALFRKMAEEKEFCEEILQVILGDKNLKVISNNAQYVVSNLQGRSVILDAYCILGDGRKINIEVQKADDDDHQRRVRYNGSVLTANIADPGIKFKDVPNVCIVFISRFDVFNEGRALYHIDRVIRETKTAIDNGFEEIYVNAAVKDNSDVSELMDVFVKDNAYSEKFPVTSASKRRFKETEEGVNIMCDIIEEIVNQEKKDLEIRLAQAEESAVKQAARADKMEAQANKFKELLRANGIPIPQ
ncbi:MAG: Rpn family recombination-promoting nuclease/putative transposase [Ruminococcaceae bacterium]|jgi:predicted transposase/invertase (TIGR01784 family)|nr:Rpn family recombination-promoting nuclease/putative transposase [Oscillospiraceae bacterium]